MGKIISLLILSLTLTSCDYFSSGIREHCRQFMTNWASTGYTSQGIFESYIRDKHGKVIATELSCLSSELTNYHGGSIGGLVNYDTLIKDPAYIEEMLELRKAWSRGDMDYPVWKK